MFDGKKNNLIKYLGWSLLILSVVIIKIFSSSPSLVESYYSLKLYHLISYLLRLSFGWLPFSFGDVCYTIIAFFCIISLFKLFILLYKKAYTLSIFKRQLLKLIKALLWLYIIFSLFWGLNYERLGIASQLNLKNNTYTNAELKDLLCDVTDESNKARLELGDSNYKYPSIDTIYTTAINAYATATKDFLFLRYKYPSVKSSSLTFLVSYLGYSGYYNPFSGEAQVNTDLPRFNMPFVTCHEMAHQLGYASESEANFVGYLVAKGSNSQLFKYSALFELFLTANSELMNRDFVSALLNIKSLNTLVKKDIKTYKNFVLKRKNNLEPIIQTAYDQYLKANQQKSGVNSYNELVGWVIDYRKKYEDR